MAKCELFGCIPNVPQIVKTAGINSAYATTILKAVKLGKYVIEKP